MLLIKFKDTIRILKVRQYVYYDILQKAQDMAYGNRNYPLSEYDNIISEMSVAMNNLIRKPELTQEQINWLNEKVNILHQYVIENPLYINKRQVDKLIRNLTEVGINYENYGEVMNQLDYWINDINSYIDENKKNEIINNIKSILYYIILFIL